VMGLSDDVVVLEGGRFLARGTPSEVQADPRVRTAYLGDAQAGPAASARDPSSGAELLGVAGLSAGYGAAPVLEAIDLRVGEAEVVAVLGANGAGKSTLMRTLVGLHRPAHGALHFDGRDLAGLATDEIAGLGLVLVPEGRQVFPDLSVRDNLRLGAFQGRVASDPRLQPVDARIESMLVRFPRLRERIDQRAGLLSGGEQQMLAIARGLMALPRLLLLDEPSLGLAPRVVAELFEALDALRRERMTLVLVDQMASLTLALADRAYVLEEGRIVASGSAATIGADARLVRAYLGPQDAAH
jgi:branched-chain amino acid transport system ATP-binding protein